MALLAVTYLRCMSFKVIISGVLPNDRSVGHAVNTGYMKVRELTANEKTDLDSSISGYAGGWDNAFEPK